MTKKRDVGRQDDDLRPRALDRRLAFDRQRRAQRHLAEPPHQGEHGARDPAPRRGAGLHHQPAGARPPQGPLGAHRDGRAGPLHPVLLVDVPDLRGPCPRPRHVPGGGEHAPRSRRGAADGRDADLLCDRFAVHRRRHRSRRALRHLRRGQSQARQCRPARDQGALGHHQQLQRRPAADPRDPEVDAADGTIRGAARSISSAARSGTSPPPSASAPSGTWSRRSAASRPTRLIFAQSYDPDVSAADLRDLCERIGGLPTGLFINSAFVLEGVLKYFATLPPEAFNNIVVGCYDYDPFASFIHFPVIMVRQNVDQLIAEAFRIIEERRDRGAAACRSSRS